MKFDTMYTIWFNGTEWVTLVLETGANTPQTRPTQPTRVEAEAAILKEAEARGVPYRFIDLRQMIMMTRGK